MKITIDTEKEIIIVPNSYFANIDKMNAIAKAAGGNPFDYVQYIKDKYTAAIAKPLQRQSDIPTVKRNTSKK